MENALINKRTFCVPLCLPKNGQCAVLLFFFSRFFFKGLGFYSFRALKAPCQSMVLVVRNGYKRLFSGRAADRGQISPFADKHGLCDRCQPGGFFICGIKTRVDFFPHMGFRVQTMNGSDTKICFVFSCIHGESFAKSAAEGREFSSDNLVFHRNPPVTSCRCWSNLFQPYNVFRKQSIS